MLVKRNRMQSIALQKNIFRPFAKIILLFVLISTPELAAWSAPVQISSSGVNGSPVAAVGPTGNILAIWLKGNNPSAQIVSSTYTNGTWSAPITLSGTGAYRNLDVLIDNNGNSIAIWEKYDSGSIQTVSKTLLGNWSAVTTISQGGTNINPELSIGQLGTAMALWINTTNDQVLLSQSSTLGSWGSPTALFTGGGNVAIEIKMNNIGMAIALRFAEDVGVMESRFFTQGVWGASERIEDFVIDSSNTPIAAMSSTGDVLSVWTNFYTAQVQASHRPVTGPWSVATDISPEIPNSYCDVGVDDLGNGVAIWVDTNDFTIRSSSYTNGVWAASTTLSDNIGYQNAHIFVDNVGNSSAVWQFLDGGIIQVASLAAGGAWSFPPQNISTTGYNSSPFIRGNDLGNKVLLWISDDGANTTINASVE